MLYLGDCLDVLKNLEPNQFDSLVTDPPAGISFMGKEWDGNKGGRERWVQWLTEVMREAYRVMKPGAHGLVWAIPRTSHWTATALELAGFEIRDQIFHLFGSGFPKSHDISKAIDKAAGVQREVISSRVKAGDIKGKDNYGAGRNIVGVKTEVFETVPSTDAAKQWDGFGTALKPAAEIWILVRKPCSEKTVASNVMKWGTGALNIGASRIGTSTKDPNIRRNATVDSGASSIFGIGNGPDGKGPEPTGRFPANLILSHTPECEADICSIFCAVRELDRQSGKVRSSGSPSHTIRKWNKDDSTVLGFGQSSGIFYTDTGGASRFFYCAKASKRDRNAGLEGMPEVEGSGLPMRSKEGDRGGVGLDGTQTDRITRNQNFHPTVKPSKLMEYLITLITPPNGHVLDCFMGSGSTGVAASRLNFQFSGIEKDELYFKIAQKRIEASAVK